VIGGRAFARSVSRTKPGRDEAAGLDSDGLENPIRVIWETLLWVILISIVGLYIKLFKGGE